MKLGFLGTGTIASAVVQGIAADGHAITVSRRSEARSAALAEAFAAVTVADNQGVLDAAEVVFLGLMAETAPGILQGLQFRAGQKVVSFMAGLPLEALAPLVAPAEAVAIMLPFPGIAQGGSPVLALGGDDLLRGIFGRTNTVFALGSAAELDAYLCAQAVLSPAVLMVATAADWMERQGVDRVGAEGFLRTLVGSSLISGPCRPMLAALDTPGGYNQRLRRHMEQAGMEPALTEGLDRLQG